MYTYRKVVTNSIYEINERFIVYFDCIIRDILLCFECIVFNFHFDIRTVWSSRMNFVNELAERYVTTQSFIAMQEVFK